MEGTVAAILTGRFQGACLGRRERPFRWNGGNVLNREEGAVSTAEPTTDEAVIYALRRGSGPARMHDFWTGRAAAMEIVCVGTRGTGCRGI